MSEPYFYLSYAGFDRESDPYGCIRRFHEDLTSELSQRLAIRKGSVGFFDNIGVDPGDNWKETVGEALRSCHVFISMYSRAYFNSEYCGKEWQIFSMRLKAHKLSSSTGNQYAPLIMPVLLGIPEDIEPLPPVAKNIQYHDGAFPDVYRENGLRYLMIRDRLKDSYYDFLNVFSEKLIKASRNYILPPLANVPPLSEVTSAFHLEPHANVEESPRRSTEPTKGQASTPVTTKNKSTVVISSTSIDVFLSYASADRERVKFIVGALQNEGMNVWWDRNIRAGKSFSREIREKLDTAKCVVVVWSNNSVQSDWVEAEASRAKKRGVLVPVLIDSVADEIPLEFSLMQTAQLTNTSGSLLEAELRNLLDSVRELIA